MRKVMRPALLLALIALTSWASSSKPAEAGIYCDDIQGKTCNEGSTVLCFWREGGGRTYCICPSSEPGSVPTEPRWECQMGV